MYIYPENLKAKAMLWLWELRDIAIIGVANEPFDNYLSTPLASFDLHQQRIGEMAAKLLLSRLGEIPEMKHPSHLIVNHDLILRESAI